MALPNKRVSEVVDYALDFSTVLAVGERLSSALAVDVLLPEYVVIQTEALSAGDTATLQVLSPGKAIKQSNFPVGQAGQVSLVVQTGANTVISGMIVKYGVGEGTDRSKVIARVQGGEAGRIYTLRSVVTTDQGRTYEKLDTFGVLI